MGTHWSELVFFFFVETMFPGGLEASSIIKFYHWVCLHPLFFRCLRESPFGLPNRSSFLF